MLVVTQNQSITNWGGLVRGPRQQRQQRKQLFHEPLDAQFQQPQHQLRRRQVDLGVPLPPEVQSGVANTDHNKSDNIIIIMLMLIIIIIIIIIIISQHHNKIQHSPMRDTHSMPSTLCLTGNFFQSNYFLLRRR
jgi:hypothetical protein